jgi:Uma2 family endonuclease
VNIPGGGHPMAIQTSLLTAEEFAQLTDENARELIDGVVYLAPPPEPWHGETAGTVFLELGTYIRQQRLGRSYAAETGFVIRRNPDVVRAPDFAFVREERAPTRRHGYLDLVPDLVAEVVSPSDSANYLQRKMQAWLEAGVQMGLVLYPPTENLAIYRPGRDIRLLGPDDTFDGEDILPGFTCPVRNLFPR